MNVESKDYIQIKHWILMYMLIISTVQCHSSSADQIDFLVKTARHIFVRTDILL